MAPTGTVGAARYCANCDTAALAFLDRARATGEHRVAERAFLQRQGVLQDGAPNRVAHHLGSVVLVAEHRIYKPVSPVFDVRPDNALAYVLRRQKANDETDTIYFIGEITRLKHEERR